MSYKDRQYITQRPNPDCPSFSLYRGSAMGGAFGLGIGARFGAPDKTFFVYLDQIMARCY
jgi:acetolactate synthase I/II/III large subunit